MSYSSSLRHAGIVAVSIGIIGWYWWGAGPTPQPPAYHDFADQRPLLGLPHALNVISNMPFLIVGALGSAFLASAASQKHGVFVHDVERRPYWISSSASC